MLSTKRNKRHIRTGSCTSRACRCKLRVLRYTLDWDSRMSIPRPCGMLQRKRDCRTGMSACCLRRIGYVISREK